MTVHKLRGTLQEYFEHMIGQTILQVGVFDGELVIVLEDNSEVCLFQNDDGLSIQINQPEPQRAN
jgi:hypothetical protein